MKHITAELEQKIREMLDGARYAASPAMGSFPISFFVSEEHARGYVEALVWVLASAGCEQQKAITQ